MLPRRFAELPVEMQNESVSPYFELLSAKRRQLFFRRAAELPLALFLLALLLPLMGFIAAAVCFDSPGGAIYRQTRAGASPSINSAQ